MEAKPLTQSPNNVTTVHETAKKRDRRLQATLGEIWCKSAEAEATLQLMRDCVEKGVCLPQVKASLDPIFQAKKSSNPSDNSERDEEAKDCLMRIKLDDAYNVQWTFTYNKNYATNMNIYLIFHFYLHSGSCINLK